MPRTTRRDPPTTKNLGGNQGRAGIPPAWFLCFRRLHQTLPKMATDSQKEPSHQQELEPTGRPARKRCGQTRHRQQPVGGPDLLVVFPGLPGRARRTKQPQIQRQGAGADGSRAGGHEAGLGRGSGAIHDQFRPEAIPRGPELHRSARGCAVVAGGGLRSG